MKTHALWFSDHFKSIFGYTLNDNFDIPTWLKHIHPEDVKKVEEITKQIFEHQNFIKTSLSYRIIDNEHKIKHIEVVWDYQVDEQGQPTFMEGMIRDITDQIRAQQQAKEHEAALNIDSLTKVYNRRFFDQVLARTCKYTQRNGGRMAIAMIDIDFFKVYNDSHGHNKGDIVLKKVAQELNSQLRRDEDYFFRVGGEEFAAIFSAKDVDGMKQVVNSLVESVRKLALPFPQSEVAGVDYVTISLGAVYTDCLDFSSTEALYEEADKLLYRAKENGRNQAITAQMCSNL